MRNLSGIAMMNRWKSNSLWLLLAILTMCGCSQVEDNGPKVAVVSAAKMNLLYVGVENPVVLAISGVPASSVILECSEAVIEGSNGNYSVKVGTPGTVELAVSYKDNDGTIQKLGAYTFRVKLIPDPVASFGGKKGVDIISIQELNKIENVSASFENFDWDMKVQVLSFECSMVLNGAEVTCKSDGDQVSEEQKKYLAKAREGSKIYIENIKVLLPDGTTRNIPGVTLKVI